MSARRRAPVRVKKIPVRSHQGDSQLQSVAPLLSASSHSIIRVADRQEVAPAFDYPSNSVRHSGGAGASTGGCEKDTGDADMTTDVAQREREFRRQRGDREHEDLDGATMKRTSSRDVVETTRAGDSECRESTQKSQSTSAVVGAGPNDALGSNRGGQGEIPTGTQMPHLLATSNNSQATRSAAKMDSVGGTNSPPPWERRSGNIDPHLRREDPQIVETQSSAPNSSPPKRREASVPRDISSPPPPRGSSGKRGILGIPSIPVPGVQEEGERGTLIAVSGTEEARAVEKKKTICLDNGTDSSNATNKHKQIVQHRRSDEAVAPKMSDSGEGTDDCAPLDAEQTYDGISKGDGSAPRGSTGVEPDEPAVDAAMSGENNFISWSPIFYGGGDHRDLWAEH